MIACQWIDFYQDQKVHQESVEVEDHQEVEEAAAASVEVASAEEEPQEEVVSVEEHQEVDPEEVVSIEEEHPEVVDMEGEDLKDDQVYYILFAIIKINQTFKSYLNLSLASSTLLKIF
jgi:GTP cyclohydrolase III